MNARLGFAIAAHLSPDVLIIDEVLAVGDFEFQQRAFGRMKELARSGIPVVVVSHQLDRIAELCTRAILLERGGVKFAGATLEAIRQYLAVEQAPSDPEGAVVLDEVILHAGEQVRSGDRVRVSITGKVNAGRATGREIVALSLRSLEDGRTLSTVRTDHGDLTLPESGPFRLEFTLDLNVQPGLYGLDSSVRIKERRGDIGSGPGLHVQILKGRPFEGMVQTNADVALSNPGDAAPALRLEPSRTGTN
jgi:hypothetical protein